MINDVLQNDDFKIEVVRLLRNYGSAVVNIIAYVLRDIRSKYIALVNNDLVPEPQSLNKLIDILRKHPKIAGV